MSNLLTKEQIEEVASAIFPPIKLPSFLIKEPKLSLKTLSEELAQETFGSEDNATAIDIDTVRSIADIIFALLERCRERREAQQVAESISNPGFIHQVAVRRRVRRELSRQEWRTHGRELAQNMIKKAQASSPVEALALVREIDNN